MSKCVLLVRVSSKAQEFESQTVVVKNQALSDGYSESDIILIQDKESASKLSLEERAGLNKLKHTIENEPVSAVYVYEISRISRKETILYSIRDYLQKNHVQLVCCMPPFRMFNDDWSISDAAAFTFSIFSTLSSQETRLRVARITRGKEKKKAEGRLTCGKPKLGYILSPDKHPIPDPKYAPIIQEIFNRYAAHESAGSIGRDLFLRHALPINTNKEITYQTCISQILRDGRYAKIDDSSIYPALVSKTLFYKAQDIISDTPERFKRKSLTKAVYPLQGYIYTPDGYLLIPSITNNRYLKMKSGGTLTPFSLNMKAVHELSTIIMNSYLNSAKIEADREEEHRTIRNTYSTNQSKILNIDTLIHELELENERINSRIIKGRLPESKGDSLIDDNIKKMHSLEDTKADLEYANGQLLNKMTYLSNPLLYESEKEEVKDDVSLKNMVQKYLKRVDVEKLGYSRYKLKYTFLDSTIKSGCFYSMHSKIEFYDIE